MTVNFRGHEVRVAAFDVDGTLARDDSAVSDATVRALRRLHDAGVHLIVATGRPAYLGADIFRRIGVDGHVVGVNGGLTIDTATGDVITESPLEEDLFEAALRLGEEEDVETYVFARNGLYANVRGPGSELLGRINAPYVVHFGPLREMDDEPLKIMYHVAASRMADFKVVAASRFPQVVQTLNTTIELSNAHATKWYGMKPVLDRLGVDPVNVLGVGDSENDLTWMPNIGVPVAPSNAFQAVKDISLHVIGSNDADGVARFIEAELLG